MENLILARLQEIVQIFPNFEDSCIKSIEKAAILVAEAFGSGSKILICGNGGSAADAQHLAAEFVSTFASDISRKALPAIALTVDSSIITAYSNDFSFIDVFARQIEAYGKPGDVLIVLSTSGKSKNCISACMKAAELGLKTISFTRTSGVIAKNSDVAIEIPSLNTQHIQEFHMISYHILVELVENLLFRNGGK